MHLAIEGFCSVVHSLLYLSVVLNFFPFFVKAKLIKAENNVTQKKSNFQFLVSLMKSYRLVELGTCPVLDCRQADVGQRFLWRKHNLDIEEMAIVALSKF